MWKLSVVVAHQSTGKLFPAAGLYGEKLDFPGTSRCSVLLGEYPSFCEEQTFAYKGVVSRPVGCLCTLGTIGVSLEVLILGFGYFSIKLCPSDATGNISWSCWSDSRSEADQIHSPYNFWQMYISGTTPHFWCNKCLYRTWKSKGKGLAGVASGALVIPGIFAPLDQSTWAAATLWGSSLAFLGPEMPTAV